MTIDEILLFPFPQTLAPLSSVDPNPFPPFPLPMMPRDIDPIVVDEYLSVLHAQMRVIQWKIQTWTVAQEHLRGLSKLYESTFAHAAYWSADMPGTNVESGMGFVPPHTNFNPSQQWADLPFNVLDTLATDMENVSLVGNFAEPPYQGTEHSTFPRQPDLSPIAHGFPAANPSLEIYRPSCHTQDLGASGRLPRLDAPANECAAEANIQCSHAPLSISPIYQPAPLAPPVVELLEQGTYVGKQRIEGTPTAPIRFNGDVGVLHSDLESLVNGDAPAFEHEASIGPRPSIHFQLVQYPQATSRTTQVWIRKSDGSPVTLRKLAERVFDVITKFAHDASEAGNPLRHKGQVVASKDIVLVRLQHVSKGSMQAIFGVRCAG